jgi:hypothetical protein
VPWSAPGTPPAILIGRSSVDPADLCRLVDQYFGDVVKLVVDVRRRVVAIGGELHADAEALLLGDGHAVREIVHARVGRGEPL